MNHLKGGEYSRQRGIKTQGVFAVVNSNDTNNDLLDAKKALVSRQACPPELLHFVCKQSFHIKFV